MLEKWEHRAVGNGKVFGALLTDLSKTLDWVCHDLLIAKLNAYDWPHLDLRCTNTDFKICQYLRLHMQIIC